MNSNNNNNNILNRIKKLFSDIIEILRETVKFNDDKINHNEIRNKILSEIKFEGYNVWILICSIVICSVGLNINSSAVVIGAMLISPLMGPILGVGLTVGTNDLDNLKESVKNFLIALLVSLTTSIIFFFITPLNEAQSELLLRTQPTFLDVLIAIFGGLAGIISVSRKTSNTVIPGVAIATALMPPICTAGYGLAHWNLNYFFGAIYLFLLNSVFITISTLIIIRYLNFPLISFVDKSTEKRVKRYIITFCAIVIIPSAFLFIKITKKSIFESRAKFFSKNVLEYKGSEIINEKYNYDKSGSEIEIFMIGKQVPDDIIWVWKNKLNDYDLNNTNLKIIQNKDNKEELTGTITKEVKTGIIKDLYELNYKELQSKNKIIDSLNNKIKLSNKNNYDWDQLKNEIFVLYPELVSMYFSNSILIDSTSIDTIPILITRWEKDNNYPNKLNNWLRLRLDIDSIEIIEEKNR